MKKTTRKRTIALVSTLAMLLAIAIPAFGVTASAAESETYNHYYGLLHAHTGNSDGVLDYRDAFDMARYEAGCDFFACTEHAEVFCTGLDTDPGRWERGRKVAQNLTENGKFVAITGYEITWPDSVGPNLYGHMNGFNTKDYYSAENPRYANKEDGSGPQNYFDDFAKLEGAIGQFNHPFSLVFGNFHDFAYWTPERDENMNLIEVANGISPVLLFDFAGFARTRTLATYVRFEREFNAALSKGWHLGPTNNQDNHNASWGTANNHRTVLLAKELTRSALYDAMANRRVYATEDKNMKVDFTINGEVMGTILDHSPSELNVSVKASTSTANIGRIELIGENGRVVKAKTFLSKTAQWDFTIPAEHKHYYIKIGPSFTFTAPIWVKDNCRVIFDTDKTAQPATVRRGEPVAKPADPVQKGASFLGWYVNGNDIETFAGMAGAFSMSRETVMNNKFLFQMMGKLF